MVSSYKNIVRIKVLAEAFTKLPHKIVFVGGAGVELYYDNPREVYLTHNVGVVEIMNYEEIDLES